MSVMNASAASDLDRVRQAFADGRLVSPGAPGPDLVDFSRAMASLCGVHGLKLSPDGEKLRELVGPAEHQVLVLIDGLGVEQLERFPRDGFLHSRSRTEMRSVFLASTAPALTSLYTGEYPAQHGVLAWWLRLPDADMNVTILPFIERFSERPLTELGVEADAVLTVPSLIGRMTHRPLAILPDELVGSVYSTYSSGGTEQVGYAEVTEAFELATARLLAATAPTFTYLYLPQADSVAHADGCDDHKVLELFALYDRLLAEFSERLGGNARVSVTGDHGQVDVPDERVLFLEEDDPISECLACPPSGEPMIPFFHLKEARAGDFADMFRDRWSQHFALLSRDEAVGLGLFGPGSPDAIAAKRMGDFLALPERPTTLRWRARGKTVDVHRGEHGGLSYPERTVPLFNF
jgi:Type I phosphodiesterase / nucleotide pyrophosphatase